MLIIAISFGTTTDPFTTSTVCKDPGVNPADADDCLDFICKDKNLHPEWVDEILVVYHSPHTGEIGVMHHHAEFG